MDYSKYRLSGFEKIRLVSEWLVISGTISYFFYYSLFPMAVLFPGIYFYIKYRKKEYLYQRKWRMTLHFRDAILMVSSNLRAGNSVENSFRKSYEELKQLYGDKSEIVKEFLTIKRGLDNNIVLENMLTDLAKRSQIEEIEDFVQIFVIAKRTTGNLRDIISDSSSTISEKIEMRREMRVLIAAKQFEHRLMCVIPFLIIGYISMTSKGYFMPLYHNLSGIGVMTGCLAVYVFAVLWGNRITAIEKLEEE